MTVEVEATAKEFAVHRLRADLLDPARLSSPGSTTSRISLEQQASGVRIALTMPMKKFRERQFFTHGTCLATPLNSDGPIIERCDAGSKHNWPLGVLGHVTALADFALSRSRRHESPGDEAGA